ncbi:cobalamin 5'-phosphate synthase [Halorubrum californiense DSM 19288]|uniref:Adenosylcobinamide-GDP ribazoletransferase n=1 Tax=Halorubrum californiense DSM 19288 TaxID=1227465 RepID=M0E9T5_9EURY|nr:MULTISPECIES: adenosylcobinamide-GDP ribazoletransferase [Halorubrum]ELZ43828.1 cobalamin 5'-phosphate synthase [Halorubrum californiense DSM 19288]TKX69334.1 adenosylcobinamide-GDP ribazoletransferase [Halorubrum sp. GN11GM_10-3_MGM]
MVLTLAALRGALGFCSRVPVGRADADWEAFRRTPAALPAVGYAIGALVALPVAAATLLPVRIPSLTVGVAFAAWAYLITGITHLDGVADLGDAAVVHGDADRRREVLKDSALGVGGTVALALTVVALAAAGTAIAEVVHLYPVSVIVLVIVAEVGAKAATAALVCVGEAAHEGLGSALTEVSGPRSLLGVALVALPAALLGPTVVRFGGGTLVAGALTGAAGVAALAFAWANARLGGISGDVLGATNELARVVGLHAGVIAWTLS